ncbi:MAG: hypothetical protein DRH90_19045, partial [Deltaproteobacteria bacterium]
FERINGPDPQFKGDDVWQDDQKASIKVIAVRHDYHDEDIAQGIAQCLNINGLNAMKADLNLGGFNLINEGTGEEYVKDGSWIPTLPSGFTVGGNHGGSYVRIGRLVTIMANVQWTANAATPLDPFLIQGLPYSIASPNGGTNAQYLGNWMGVQGINMADNTSYIFVRGITVVATDTIQPSQYWGTNDPPNTPPDPNDQIVGIINGQTEATGEYTFNMMYLTNDPED